MVKINYTKPLRSLLVEGGIWMNFSDRKYGMLFKGFQIFRFFYLLSLWVLLLYKLFNEGLRFLLTPSAVFIPLGGVLLILAAIMMIQSEKLEHLIDQYEINFSVYRKDWEVEIIKTDCAKLTTFINLVRFLFRNFALLYVFLPLVIDGIRAVLGYTSPYSLPTPLDGYMESNSSRNVYFYLITIASDIWFMIGMSTCIGIECVIFFMVSYSTTEMKIMKTYLKKLQRRNMTESLTSEIELLPPWNLKQVIVYHQQIIRLNTLQKDCISFPYITQNVSATVSLCFIMFLIRQLIGENTMMLLLTVTFILMIMGLLFIVCYAGEFLQAESEEIFLELYNIPWYRQSPRVRKDILIMMKQAAKPLVLDYKQSSINLPAFKEIMNNSYSYFMLMNSVSPT